MLIDELEDELVLELEDELDIFMNPKKERFVKSS